MDMFVYQELTEMESVSVFATVVLPSLRLWYVFSGIQQVVFWLARLSIHCRVTLKRLCLLMEDMSGCLSWCHLN